MNQDPNGTQTGGNNAFSQAPGTQTNPFTGDLRGEFASDFGTSTNAVSQIFKSAGFAGGDRNKIILIAVAVIAILGGVLYYLFSDSLSEDPFAGDEDTPASEEGAKDANGEALDPATKEAGATAAGEDPSAAATEGAATPSTPPSAQTPSAAAAEAPAPAAAEATPGVGTIALAGPDDGAASTYDETHGPAIFTWEGAADRIVFARHPSMQPIVRSGNISGKTSYGLSHPYPGTWYWRVENSSGQSNVRKFVVQGAARRSFPVSAPQAGGALSGNGGIVSWQAGKQIASYRVELNPSGQGFSNAAHRYGTSGTTVTLQSVPAGTYDLRVGAFSEVAGRWEWQLIPGVNVQ